MAAVAVQTHFVPTPETNSNRPARLCPDSHENPRCLHGCSDAGTIVDGSGTDRLRLQMRTDDDDLMRQISSRDFSNNVVVVRVVSRKLDPDLEFHLNRNVFLQNPHHAVVVLCRNDYLGNWGWSVCFPHTPFH